MSTNEQRPNVQWEFPPEKPKRGRAWLIAVLVVTALLVAAAIVFFLLPRDGSPTPGTSTSPSPAASTSAKPTSSPQPTNTATAIPSAEPSAPETVAPEPVDPDVETFRGIVGPRLDDALTGLSMIEETSGQDAVSIVNQLQQDLQLLSDTVAPNSIQAEWRAALTAYGESLANLRAAAEAGEDLASEISDSTREVNFLRSLVGM